MSGSWSRSWKNAAVSLLPMSVGAGIVALAFFDPRDEAFPHGRIVVVFAGGAFLLAGLSILFHDLPEGKAREIAGGLVAALLLSCFAAIPFWIMLSTGSRALLVVSFLPCAALALLGWYHLGRRIFRDAATRARALRALLVLGACVAVTICVLAGTLLLQSPVRPGEATPDGAWAGDGWGKVVLFRRSDGSYEGTYTDTYGAAPGRIEVAPQLEGTHGFAGRWWEGDARSGTIAFDLLPDGETIQGAWSSSSGCGISPGSPVNEPLTWRRVRMEEE